MTVADAWLEINALDLFVFAVRLVGGVCSRELLNVSAILIGFWRQDLLVESDGRFQRFLEL